jgi:hypothetical protein
MGYFLKDISTKYNLKSTRTQAWGMVNGFWFQFQVMAQVRRKTPMKIHTAVDCQNDDGKALIASTLKELVQNKKIAGFADKSGSIEITKNMPYGGFKTDDVEALLLYLAAIFANAGAVPVCYYCHESAGNSYAEHNGQALLMCWKCIEKFENEIHQSEEELKSVPNNYLRGILGALIGALLGVLLWVVFGYLGRIAAIAGMAIAFCAIKGYAIMKGKTTPRAVLIICGISLVMMVLAQFISYDVLICKAIIAEGDLVDYGKLIRHTFELPFMDSESTQSFIMNMLMGLLFLGAGSWRLIQSLHLQAKAPAGKIVRLEQ